MSTAGAIPQDHLAAGRQALKSGDWQRARTHFEAALREAESPEAHDGLGLALWWLNEIAAAHEQRMLGYAGFKRQGDLARAGLIAAWLAREQLFFRANATAMAGWFARGERLLRAAGACVEAAWFTLLRASVCSSSAELERIALDALQQAEAFSDGDLEAMARAYYGLARVTLGHIADGMGALDEALTESIGGEVTSFVNVGEVYCVLLSACEIAGDLVRLDHWLAAATSFAHQQGSAYLSAYCRTTYGGLLAATGRWDEAETELLVAMHAFAAGHSGLRIQAVARPAQLRIQEGRLEEAQTLLAGYEDHPAAALPLAQLHLARQEAPLACALINQHVPDTLQAEVGQIPWLLLAAEVQLALGDIAAARSAADQAAHLARECGSPLLLAQAMLAQGQVKRHAGEPDVHACLLSALSHVRMYDQAYIAGRIRLELARDLAATDWPAAVTWARAALATFERVGAPRDADAVRQTLRDLGVGPGSGARIAGTLTGRESQVLALLATGITNRSIAERLYITPKTAEHHVSQILQKLGAHNRAEAITIAHREGLVPSQI